MVIVVRYLRYAGLLLVVKSCNCSSEAVMLGTIEEYMTEAASRYSAICMPAGDIHTSDEPGAGVLKC